MSDDRKTRVKEGDVFYGIAWDVHDKLRMIGDLGTSVDLFHKAGEDLSNESRPGIVVEVRVLKVHTGPSTEKKR
jgi:hypothetical protein